MRLLGSQDDEVGPGVEGVGRAGHRLDRDAGRALGMRVGPSREHLRPRVRLVGVHGEELWKSDGSTAGTVLVKDINPGARER